MPTGGTVSNGNCLTSDDGCCDLVPECRDDGTCQLPPPVCTTDGDCDNVGDHCADGLACVSPDDIEITPFAPGSSLYLGVIQYDSRELFLVGTGDISSGFYFLSEIVSFDEDVGANVHVALDESGRPLSAYAEGNEDEVLIYVYDDNDNLVSIVEAGGGNGRRLGMVPRSTSVFQEGARRLIPIIPPLILGIIIWQVLNTPGEAIPAIFPLVALSDPVTCNVEHSLWWLTTNLRQ